MNKYKLEIEKIASSRDEDMETRFFRDRLGPEFKRGIQTIPHAIGGGLAGGLAGAMVGGSNLAPHTAYIGSGLASAAGMYSKRKKKFEELKDRYRGDISEEQNELASNSGEKHNKRKLMLGAASSMPVVGTPFGMVSGPYSLAKTPESIIQKARRNTIYENSNENFMD